MRLTLRKAALLLHRYVGLAIAGFLIVAGLTGAAIAWNDELERVFAPSMFVLPPAAAARPAMDPFALRAAASRAVPGFAVNFLDFTRRPDEPARFYVQARPGGPDPVADEIALDPASGTVIGRRLRGDIRQGTINLMPFVYDLHDSLALGSTGALVLGVVALLWTLDCFVGAYLTLPMRAKAPRPPMRWLAAWRGAWTIRWPSTAFKAIFDLHRAPGLWLWGLLLVIAWSSVAFNLPAVYVPVTRALFGLEPLPPPRAARRAASPVRLDWRTAYDVAKRSMNEKARQYGFTVRTDRLMFFDPASRSYDYRVLSSLDPGLLGNTRITIDADDGHILAFARPTGAAAGNTLTTWIEAIHTANILGWPMKVAISAAGLAVATLSATGMLIYVRKRRSHEAKFASLRAKRCAQPTPTRETVNHVPVQTGQKPLA